MLTAYRGREWSKALEVLILCRDAGKSFGLDEFYSLYITRVRSLWEAPLPEDWDGVYVAESK
jgi:adenylate cyclase